MFLPELSASKNDELFIAVVTLYRCDFFFSDYDEKNARN